MPAPPGPLPFVLMAEAKVTRTYAIYGSGIHENACIDREG